jgi:hypothetical protein
MFYLIFMVLSLVNLAISADISPGRKADECAFSFG